MKKVFYKQSGFYIFSLFLLFAIIGILSFRPIINPKEEDCTKIIGTLHKCRQLKEEKDIQFKIVENSHVYYLNNLLDPENKLNDLNALIGEKIVIYAVDHWTLLDPKSKYKHVARITNEDESMIIYSEY